MTEKSKAGTADAIYEELSERLDCTDKDHPGYEMLRYAVDVAWQHSMRALGAVECK